MRQHRLFKNEPETDKSKISVGHGLFIKKSENDPDQVFLYRLKDIIKKAHFSDKTAKRIFVVDCVELGADKSPLAQALGISRQTIHNYLETKKNFGLEGLIHNYKRSDSKSLRKQRELHSAQRSGGTKAELVAEIRKKEREERAKQQRTLEFDFAPSGDTKPVPKNEQPYIVEHEWEASRYAGVFCYLITLVSDWRWLHLVMGYYGSDFKIFMVFALMAATNTRSIEQLKNIRSRESGLVLGFDRLPSKPIIWTWFFNAANQRISSYLLEDYIRFQMRAGHVGLWIWFIDGHLLPYTGKERVHHSYNTQRRLPVPGQTNLVTCDESGRVVVFDIQEGKGDLFGQVNELADNWSGDLPMCPVMVFDREISGAGYFSNFVEKNIPFVSWEKNIDSEKLAELEDDLFTVNLEFNGKQYSLFEGEKKFSFKSKKEPNKPPHEFTLRRIYIWNKSSKRRVCGLAWSGDHELSTSDCAIAILSRWGASENTFKHLQNRHPYHYQPGFELTVSGKQDIKNPEITKKEGIIRRCGKKVAGLYKKLTKTSEVKNKDGSVRKNSARERTKANIEELESKIEKSKAEKKSLPERVEVSTLEDYKSFKKIDNEGKNLFDFATCSIWNARKQMVDWLKPFFNEENEIVDLFYAIADCHGWVKTTRDKVIVRIEPLERPKRRMAQEQLCRKLTNLGAVTPTGKWMVIEVGNCPVK